MSLKNPDDGTETFDLSELRMAVMYGAEGLRRCTETTDYDEWLSLFEASLHELERPSREGRGNFPLKEAAISNPEKREEIIREMRELIDLADRLRSTTIDDRSEFGEEIGASIQKAERLYDELGEIQEESDQAFRIG